VLKIGDGVEGENAYSERVRVDVEKNEVGADTLASDVSTVMVLEIEAGSVNMKTEAESITTPRPADDKEFDSEADETDENDLTEATVCLEPRANGDNVD
jgi:hypothetical protein